MKNYLPLPLKVWFVVIKICLLLFIKMHLNIVIKHALVLDLYVFVNFL